MGQHAAGQRAIGAVLSRAWRKRGGCSAGGVHSHHLGGGTTASLDDDAPPRDLGRRSRDASGGSGDV